MSLPVLFRKPSLPFVSSDRASLPVAVVVPLCLVGAIFVPWWLSVGVVAFAGWRFWTKVR